MFHRARTRVKTKVEDQAVKANGNKVVLCHCPLSDNSCVPVVTVTWSGLLRGTPGNTQFSLCLSETNDFIPEYLFPETEKVTAICKSFGRGLGYGELIDSNSEFSPRIQYACESLECLPEKG